MDRAAFTGLLQLEKLPGGQLRCRMLPSHGEIAHGGKITHSVVVACRVACSVVADEHPKRARREPRAGFILIIIVSSSSSSTRRQGAKEREVPLHQVLQGRGDEEGPGLRTRARGGKEVQEEPVVGGRAWDGGGGGEFRVAVCVGS